METEITPHCNKKRKGKSKPYWKSLDARVEELERLVKELIEYKQDKEVIIMKNWKPLWYDIHDYKPDF